MRRVISTLKSKAAPVMAVVGSALLPISAFAADSGTDVTSAMTSAFTSIKTDFLSTVGVVGPIALAIAGTFIIWKLGKKFFSGLAK